jgi:hypothetical protein
VHAGSVGIEDAGDPDVDPVLLVVVEKKRLGAAFSLVVAETSLVEAWRILAPTRLARPSMLIAPITEVFTVLMALCW